MKPVLLAWDINDLVLPLIFLAFLVLVVAGQKLAQWIFRKFSNENRKVTQVESDDLV